jgi:transposase
VKSRLFACFLTIAAFALASSCASGGETVVKPRYHKSWYKKHTWNKRWRIGRLQVRPFEKQGVKKVKMKG